MERAEKAELITSLQSSFAAAGSIVVAQNAGLTVADLENLRKQGLVSFNDQEVRLSREGLLRVDELIHDFFLPQHREVAIA